MRDAGCSCRFYVQVMVVVPDVEVAIIIGPSQPIVVSQLVWLSFTIRQHPVEVGAVAAIAARLPPITLGY